MSKSRSKPRTRTKFKITATAEQLDALTGDLETILSEEDVGA